MIKNIKLKVETDEENQYVLNKLIDINKDFAWIVYLFYGYDYYDIFQDYDSSRAVCSVWKGFRYFVICDDFALILYALKDRYDRRNEKEITFEEFREMVEKE